MMLRLITLAITALVSSQALGVTQFIRCDGTGADEAVSLQLTVQVVGASERLVAMTDESASEGTVRLTQLTAATLDRGGTTFRQFSGADPDDASAVSVLVIPHDGSARPVGTYERHLGQTEQTLGVSCRISSP
jgi:hypothetical protein